MNIPNNLIIQHAYVVRDLDEAMRTFSARAGYGPWLVIRHWDIPKIEYRGKRSKIDISVALSQSGSLNIELVHQHDNSPSCFRDIFAEGQQGFHHTAMFIRDYEDTVAAYAEVGCPCVQVTELDDGSKGAFIDTSAITGHMLEIYCDPHGRLRAIHDAVREITAGIKERDRVLEAVDWLSRVKT